MAETREAPERRLPEHVTTPLLTLITARSMDEDYAHVAQQRAAAGEEPVQGRRPHWISLVAVAALGIMGAVVAAQTDRQAEVNELSRAALVEQIDSKRDQVRDLQARVAALTRSNQAVASSNTRIQGQLDDLESRVRRAELNTGFAAVPGPGGRLTDRRRKLHRSSPIDEAGPTRPGSGRG